MNIDEMTIGEFKNLQSAFGSRKQKYFPYKVGDKVFIRSVTLYYIGKIEKIEGDWVTLSNASWIADTGRFFDFLKDGECNEYESFQNNVSIHIGSMIDITEWKHDLFSGNK